MKLDAMKNMRFILFTAKGGKKREKHTPNYNAVEIQRVGYLVCVQQCMYYYYCHKK